MEQLATWAYDPDGTFPGRAQRLPFGRGAQDVMEPSIEAGALGFIGGLTDYPGDSHDYYVPYDGVSRPIPGVWISGSDGARIAALMADGPVRATVRIDAERENITSYNIVGELPGADDEAVIIGSHHDGPWASAVEDASGIALVLAQAAYWSRVPQSERPHRLVFLLNGGHMAGGAGQGAFVREHRDELERCVVEVHLEHAANEVVEEDGALRATGEPEVRVVHVAACAARSDGASGDRGGGFAAVVHRAADAVRREADDGRRGLPPGGRAAGAVSDRTVLPLRRDGHTGQDPPADVSALTRAAIRIVESTAGVSARAMRDAG